MLMAPYPTLAPTSTPRLAPRLSMRIRNIMASSGVVHISVHGNFSRNALRDSGLASAGPCPRTAHSPARESAMDARKRSRLRIAGILARSTAGGKAVVNAVVNTLETLPTAPFRVYRTVIAMLNLRRGLTSPELAPPRVAHAGERFSWAPGRETAPPRFPPPKRPGSRLLGSKQSASCRITAYSEGRGAPMAASDITRYRSDLDARHGGDRKSTRLNSSPANI